MSPQSLLAAALVAGLLATGGAGFYLQGGPASPPSGPGPAASTSSGLLAVEPPAVALLYPEGGETLSGQVEVLWKGSDAQGRNLTARLEWTSDPEPACPSCPPQRWHTLAENLTTNLSANSSYLWDTSGFEERDDYLLRVVVDNGAERAGDVSGRFAIAD